MGGTANRQSCKRRLNIHQFFIVASFRPRMEDNEEKWKELCAQAAVEQDPYKLSELVNEIIRLIEQRKEQISGKRSEEESGTGIKPDES